MQVLFQFKKKISLILVNLMQYPKNELERKQMENIPYAFIVESLMHA